MTANRPYRQAIGRDAAREELRRCAGTQFDDSVVGAILRFLEGEVASEDPALQGKPDTAPRGVLSDRVPDRLGQA